MNLPACPRIEEIKLTCSCPKVDCANHGRCCSCIQNHRKIGKPVHCMAVLTGKK